MCHEAPGIPIRLLTLSATPSPTDKLDVATHLPPRSLSDVPPVLLTVKGTPRPQPRPRFVRGRVVSTADANARRWIASVEAAARQAAASHGKQAGPLSVLMTFYFPSRDTSRHGQAHTSRPDADNLAKLALDSIMRAGLIGDDAAVSCLVVRKTWGDTSQAGAAITLGQDRRVVLPPDPTRPDWI